MRRIKSGDGATDLGAEKDLTQRHLHIESQGALGGLDNVIPDIVVEQSEGAPSGATHLCRDMDGPVDKLIDEIRDAKELLDTGDGKAVIILELLERLATIVRGPEPLPIGPISDMTREQYLALSEDDKKARVIHQSDYSAQFPFGKYPRREQLTSENQRYADGQRAAGYNPPGVYC